MKKTMIAAVAAMLLIVSVFAAGCTGTATPAPATTSPASTVASEATTSAEATPAPEEPLFSNQLEKPVEFSYLAAIWGPATTEIYSAFADEYFKAANVKIDATFVPFTEYDTKFPTMVMAGNIPDVFWNNGREDSIANDLISQGAMLPLDDLIAKYELFRSQYPDFIWANLKSMDGKTYGLPSQVISVFVPFPIMIRKDLFDKYSLPIPTTVDELTASIKTIQKNEPGMFGLTTDYYDPWAFQNLGVAFGYGFSNWVPDPKDPARIVPSFMGTGFVDFFKYMNQLRNDGVLDPDMGIVKNAGGHDKFISGKCVAEIGGATNFDTMGIIKALKEVNPAYEAVLIPPIQGPAQKTGCTVLSNVLKVVSLSSKAADKADSIFKVFNWMSTDEGYDMMRYGIKGKTYRKMDDGSGTYNPSLYVEFPDEDRASGYLKDNVKLWRIFLNYEKEIAPNWKADYINTLRVTRKLGLDDKTAQNITEMRKSMFHEAAKNAIPDYRKGTFTASYAEKFNQLSTQFIIPMRDKLLIGETFDMVEYDKAINDFLANGGQQIIDDVNAAMKDKTPPTVPSFVEIDFSDYGSITDKDINPQDYYPDAK